MLQGLSGSISQASVARANSTQMHKIAQELEVTFLSEMLKGAGLGQSPDGFGGGAGEDQFSSFLRDEQARQIVMAGGLGLTEVFFNAMKENADG